MKAAIFVARWLILGALAAASAQAQSADKPASVATSGKTRKAGQPSAARPSLSRDMVFDGSTITGKYLSAGEATAVVEQEKKMNELIGPRADFNDRLRAERSALGRGQKNQ